MALKTISNADIAALVRAALPKRVIGAVVRDCVAEEIGDADCLDAQCRLRGAEQYSVAVGRERYPVIACPKCGGVWWGTFPSQKDADGWPENHRIGTL